MICPSEYVGLGLGRRVSLLLEDSPCCGGKYPGADVDGTYVGFVGMGLVGLGVVNGRCVVTKAVELT